MNIDPYNEEFTEIDHHVVGKNTLAGVADIDEKKVKAIAHSEDALRKLQDDLRKAGYKKVK